MSIGHGTGQNQVKNGLLRPPTAPVSAFEEVFGSLPNSCLSTSSSKASHT
ncbi:MAG: hypothetical protein LBF22_00605 [Deltaproteobacteria bacterium]|nr:hypothetical protein [Deltaproteobacteria bacterium]